VKIPNRQILSLSLLIGEGEEFSLLLHFTVFNFPIKFSKKSINLLIEEFPSILTRGIDGGKCLEDVDVVVEESPQQLLVNVLFVCLLVVLISSLIFLFEESNKR